VRTVTEAHLDHPGEIHWFKSHGPAPVLGPCTHTECRHNGQGVIAWGPSYERYELVACGSIDPADESDSDCAMHCRAWVDERGRTVTPWIRVDLDREQPDQQASATARQLTDGAP
jgi:hypothetical protein